jgi:hypothetical protein
MDGAPLTAEQAMFSILNVSKKVTDLLTKIIHQNNTVLHEDREKFIDIAELKDSVVHNTQHLVHNENVIEFLNNLNHAFEVLSTRIYNDDMNNNDNSNNNGSLNDPEGANYNSNVANDPPLPMNQDPANGGRRKIKKSKKTKKIKRRRSKTKKTKKFYN